MPISGFYVFCCVSCSDDGGEQRETHYSKLLLYKSAAHSQVNLTPTNEQMLGLPPSG